MAASQIPSSKKRLPSNAEPHSKFSKSQKEKGKGKNVTVNDAAAGKNSAVLARPAFKELGSDDEGHEWAWIALADSSVSNCPPIFTKDGRYFFSIAGSSVRIYSVSSGKVVSTLSNSSSGSSASRLSDGDGHTDTITAAILHPQNPFQLLTASLDGLIKVWDFLDATLLQTIDLGSPISHMCAHEKIKGHVFVAVATQPGVEGSKSNSRSNEVIFRVALKASDKSSQQRIQMSSEVVRIGKTRLTSALAISPSGSWLVAIAGYKAHVSLISSPESGFTKFISPEKLTCLAFHPTDEYFATGDEQGQIRLWYCLNRQSFDGAGVEKRAQTSTLHWHAHSVSTIAFTANGAYLLSGGEESVLVLWQLHSGKKEFVPRVGAPIMNVAICNGGHGGEEYLLGLADSSFVFVNASTLTVSRVVSRIKIEPALSNQHTISKSSVPLAVHPLSYSLILPSSHPSSLQLYNPSTSTLLSELEVSSSNRISRRDDKPIEQSRVQRAIICNSGEWMATIDKRDGGEDFSTEVYLKVWHWESSNWSLNTRIDRPHGEKAVSNLVFSPKPLSRQGWVFVTAGTDGNVKTWSVRTVSTSDGRAENYWINRSTFSFRSEIPTYISWSSDASLMAIAFGAYVTLYDPDTNRLLDSFTSSEIKVTELMCFVGRSGRFLLVSSAKDAVLWDLVNRSIRWHFHSSHLIVNAVTDPKDDVVAIFVQPYSPEEDKRRLTRILMFRPSSIGPDETRTLPFRLRELAYFPSTSSRFSLAGITHTWSVVLFGDDVHLPEGENSRKIANGEDVTPRRTLFQDIFGKSAFEDVSSGSARSPHTRATASDGMGALTLFETPAYLAPPIETLYSSLMNDFLTPRPEEQDQMGDASTPAQVDADVITLMEVDASDSRSDRVMKDTELAFFVELFKNSSRNRPSGVKAPSSSKRVNGVLNGVRRTALNGVHDLSSPSSPLMNGGASHATTTKPYLTHSQKSSPPTAGKKRKKNQG